MNPLVLYLLGMTLLASLAYVASRGHVHVWAVSVGERLGVVALGASLVNIYVAGIVYPAGLVLGFFHAWWLPFAFMGVHLATRRRLIGAIAALLGDVPLLFLGGYAGALLVASSFLDYNP